MLSSANRLAKQKDIERVFRMGKGLKEASFYLKIASSHTKKARFTVVVGKKTAAKAVERNRIKRRIREALRPLIPRLVQGIDGVIIVLPEYQEVEFHKLQQTIEKLLRRAKLIS